MTTTELATLFKVLHGDVKEAVNKLNGSPENRAFYARSYIRAFASWVEGTVWMYKDLLKNLPDQKHLGLPLEYQLFLMDIDWTIKNSGEPKIRTKKIATAENLKAFFRLVQEFYPEFKTELPGDGFSNVVSMFKIRDRLMHPSSNNGLSISKTELSGCENGREWFISQMTQLNSCIEQSYT